MSPLTLKTLSALRVLIGATCLLVPRPAGTLFGIPLAPGPEGVLLGRMVGVRDVVLGAYLWKRVRGVEQEQQQQHEDGEVGSMAKSGAPVAAGAGEERLTRTPLLFNNKVNSSVAGGVDVSKDGNGNGNGDAGNYPSSLSGVGTGLEQGRGVGGGLAALRLAERESALHSAVWLGLVVDTIDVASVLVGSLGGGDPLSDLAKVTVGAGGLVFALIAGQHLLVHQRG
ncbi:hypothetical protein Z517_11123 [Fonsecaea pedrosoi CBS 271.37]|uniref:Uncharacterized protein n=1 Tax=Fonsecaea pedrosoi CBS 271.37 TaxID=1442368 RepID=A0A0D2EPW3_9EURO|nr:uncharacterized protein Z517_11123 [Fonsecaea pedrosoi CBS 271.37]KIW76377.1 hypothetical protein Z517_11123 [Fonsecaea pedrosoi CBS 271.37]